MKSIFIVIFITFTLSTLSAKSSDVPYWHSEEINSHVEPIVLNWEYENQINVDPRVTLMIVNEINTFVEIFGYQYDGNLRTPKSEVFKIINSKDEIRRVLHKYLDDVKTEKKVKNLSERLANIFNQSVSLAQWSKFIPIPFRLLNFENKLPESDLILSSNGKPDTKKTRYKKFLVLPGDHIITSDQESWSFSVNFQKSNTKSLLKPPKIHRGR